MQLGHPDLAERPPARGCEPAFTGRGHDQDHPVPLRRQPRHRPGRQERLIVGMGVKEHTGPSHRILMPVAGTPNVRAE